MLTKINIARSKHKLMAVSLLLGVTIVSTSALATGFTLQPQAGSPTGGTLETDMSTQDTSAAAPGKPAASAPTSGSTAENKQAGSASRPTANSAQPTTQTVQGQSAPAQSTVIASQPSVQVDEQFNGTSLNGALWEPITYPKGYRNNEEQDYRPSQVRVADGTLQLTATRDGNGQWHSGEVHSRWNYMYGDFEVRVAMSGTGPGVWPAAWLMGTTDHWPNGGEIDIFENVNGSNTAHGTIHGGGSAGHWMLQSWYSPVSVTQFHTYKIVKRPGVISWWVDGVKRGEWTQAQTPAGGTWPFESHRNFGLLNLAIGGNWPGPSNASTPDNLVMHVDYFTVKNAS